VEEALDAGDRDAALNALKVAEPEMMRGATKGVLHRNTAQRKISRLTRRAAKLGKKS
jgi:small subunit ribosomal protein S20